MGMRTEHHTTPRRDSLRNPKADLLREIRRKGVPAVASAGMTLWIADPIAGIRTAYRWIPVRGYRGVFLLEDAQRLAEDSGMSPQEAFAELPLRIAEILTLFWYQAEVLGAPRHTEVCLWSPPSLRTERFLGIKDPIPRIDTKTIRRRRSEG